MDNPFTDQEWAMYEAGKKKAENTLTGRGLLYATAGGALLGALLMRTLMVWGVVT